jgi:hypothetical protein
MIQANTASESSERQMSSARVVSVWLVVVVVVSVGLGPAVVDEATAQSQPSADTTVTRIELDADGDARWTVQVRTALDDEEDVERYRAFQESFRNDSTAFLDAFETRITGTVRTAATETGREMAAEEFAISTSIQEVPRRWGVVTYTFTWTNFAVRDGARLVVGDVFGTGFFLTENDSLELVAPPDYVFRSVEPDPTSRDDGVVVWQGRADFSAAHPRAVVEPADDDSASPSPSGSVPWQAILTVGLVLVGGSVLLWWGRTHRPGGSGDDASDGESGGGDDDRGEESGEPLLTDADRVRQTVREHGGRVKQSTVADELGWSASKTSRVVGSMADDDEVRKLRIGRENVLELPEEEPS